MLYDISGDKVTPVTFSNEADNPFDRVIDEYKGWKKYTCLKKRTQQDKYSTLALDEFKHMLVALDDALTSVKIDEGFGDLERAELTRFLNSFKVS